MARSDEWAQYHEVHAINGQSRKSGKCAEKLNAHDAVRATQAYIREGNDWVVDVEKFFDRVNHDKLIARVACVVKDKRVLKLIRANLESGVMVNGGVMDTEEGTPQGEPLSPLLANIMLDDLDKELEQRGHRFVRYADDGNTLALAGTQMPGST